MSARARSLAWRLALVGVGGATGAVVRVWLEDQLGSAPTLAPGVLVANLLGAFVIGAVLAAAPRLDPIAGLRLRLLVATGFCGGLTTLSSLALVLADGAEEGRWVGAIGTALLSIAGGIAAFFLGRALLGLLTRAAARIAPKPADRIVPLEVSDE